jgi:hypothetical protein
LAQFQLAARSDAFSGNVSDEPDGCSIYNGIGRWEGDAVVFRFVFQVSGAADYVEEVISRSGPDSCTAVFFHGKSEALVEPAHTWRHTRRQ